MSERSVLITGATGAVGGAVVDAMLEAGWHVVATWLVPEERLEPVRPGAVSTAPAR